MDLAVIPAPLQRTQPRHQTGALRRTLMHLPEPAVLIRDGKIIAINKPGQQLVGAEIDSLFGQSPLTLFHSESTEIARMQPAPMSAGIGDWHATGRILSRTDGSTRLVNAAATTVRGPKVTIQLLLMHDVTEKQSLQRNLVQSQAELHQLVIDRVIVHHKDQRSIAHELHDVLMQSLAAIRMELGAHCEHLVPYEKAFKTLLFKLGGIALSAMGRNATDCQSTSTAHAGRVGPGGGDRIIAGQLP